MVSGRSKPRGLYYADEETRKRVASKGGRARAQAIAQNKVRQGAR